MNLNLFKCLPNWLIAGFLPKMWLLKNIVHVKTPHSVRHSVNSQLLKYSFRVKRFTMSFSGCKWGMCNCRSQVFLQLLVCIANNWIFMELIIHKQYLSYKVLGLVAIIWIWNIIFMQVLTITKSAVWGIQPLGNTLFELSSFNL